jgi:hypothetical protein
MDKIELGMDERPFQTVSREEVNSKLLQRVAVWHEM